MQIERAEKLGLCFGVRRALDMLHQALKVHGPLQTLGPIAHNHALLRELESLGATVGTSIDALTGQTVLISAHGVGPEVVPALSSRGFNVIDTTCPNVARTQHIAAKLAADGLTIVIFGDHSHTEVRGLLSWAGRGSIATLDVSALCGHVTWPQTTGIGIISQTTQRLEDFALFAQRVSSELLPSTQEIRIVNTVCGATMRRQQAAAKLARNVDAMIVIGGKASANTRRLVETCEALVTTWHVETADDLPLDEIRGMGRIGLTAGASTPDSSIDQVEQRLRPL